MSGVLLGYTVWIEAMPWIHGNVANEGVYTTNLPGDPKPMAQTAVAGRDPIAVSAREVRLDRPAQLH